MFLLLSLIKTNISQFVYYLDMVTRFSMDLIYALDFVFSSKQALHTLPAT